MHENEILGKKSFNFRIRITVQFNIVIVRFNSPLMIQQHFRINK